MGVAEGAAGEFPKAAPEAREPHRHTARNRTTPPPPRTTVTERSEAGWAEGATD